MAYRETDKTRARQEAKRELIIISAIAKLAMGGDEAVTMEAVAAEAGIASGLTYRYFPDRRELLAHAAQQLLDRDLVAMRRRSMDIADPLYALAVSIAVFYGTLKNGHLARFKARSEVHCEGVRAELARLIRNAALGHGPKGAATAAASALGAVYGLFDAMGAAGRNTPPAAALFVLRGIGVEDQDARKVLAKCWGYSMADAV